MSASIFNEQVRECAQHILLGTPTNVDALALLKELRALPDVIDVRGVMCQIHSLLVLVLVLTIVLV